MNSASKNSKNKKWNGSKWIRPEKRKKIYMRDNHTCVYCNRSIYKYTDIILTLDHVTPRELGGSNRLRNLVTCCLRCNSQKRHLNLAKFLQYLVDNGIDTDGIRKRVRNARRRKLPKTKKGKV